jgi:transposase
VPRTEKIVLLKSRKVKLYPTTQEKEKLTQWFGASRWTYNQCLEWTNEHKKEKYSKKVFRDLFINNDIKKVKPDYVKDVPYDVRDEAMADLLKNIKSNCSKIKSKVIDHFKLRFRCMKKSIQSVVIRARHCARKTGVYAFLNTMKKSENVENYHVNHDFRIVKDLYGDYWMCIPCEKKYKSERQAFYFSKHRNDGVISLDPGVRTFLTGYDGFQKQVIHLGTCQNTIDKLHNELDLLKCRMSKKRNRKTMKLRKACKVKEKRIKNLVRDMHYKIAQFLCSNYKTILIPSFNTQDMVKRKNRKIRKGTARMMNTLSHYTFRRRLIEKSLEYEHCNVIVVSESYTSKTCSECGVLNKKLKSSKTFTCDDCGSIFDRDVNASKNIFLKNNV